MERFVRKDVPVIIDSMESAGFQERLLGENAINVIYSKNFLTSRLGRLTTLEQAQIGTFIIDGLSFGTSWWDRNTRSTTAQVFSMLNLGTMRSPNVLTLQNAYLRAINNQSEIPDSERSVDSLLTVGRTLLPQVIRTDNTSEFSNQMRTAWYDVVKHTQDNHARLEIAKELEHIIAENKRGRKRNPDVVARETIVAMLRDEKLTPSMIAQALGLNPVTVNNDLNHTRPSAGREERFKSGPKTSHRVKKLREDALRLHREGYNPGEIAIMLGVKASLVKNYIYRPLRPESKANVIDIVDFKE